MRSIDEYDKDVPNAGCSTTHIRGVKRRCELNAINGFHVTRNYSINVMHTLLEGVAPLELGCVLYCLVQHPVCLCFYICDLPKCVTVDQISEST